MKVIYAQEPIEDTSGIVIFLAGPTPRDPEVESWRPNALSIFENMELDCTILVPEMRNGFTDDFEYGNQIDWEQEGLERADVILFWIPRDLKDMPAFTTNIEFGYWIAKDPSKISMGFPQGTPKMDYIAYKCGEKGIYIMNSLSSTIEYTIVKHYKGYEAYERK